MKLGVTIFVEGTFYSSYKYNSKIRCFTQMSYYKNWRFCFHKLSDISINYELQQDLKIFYSSLAQILIYHGPRTKYHKCGGFLPKIIRNIRPLGTPRKNIWKGKAVPLQAWSGPEGSKKLRFPYFVTSAQDGGKVVSLTHRPPLPPGNTPGTDLC